MARTRIAPQLPLETEQHLFSAIFGLPTEVVIETRDHYNRVLDRAALGTTTLSAEALEWVKGYIAVFAHELAQRAANGSL